MFERVLPMKHSFCYCLAFLILLLAPTQTTSQITITSTDINNIMLNSKRMNHEYNFGSPVMINLGNATSSGQTFNFGSLPPEDSVESMHQNYVDPAGQPGASNFPSSNICSPTVIEPFPGATITLVAYMSIETDGLYMLGFYSHQLIPTVVDTVVVQKFLPKQLITPLPLTYGTSRVWVDTLYVDEASNSFIRTTTNFMCDGWGDITLPPLPGVATPKVGGVSALRFRVDEVEDVYVGGIFSSRERSVDISYITADGTILDMEQPDTNYTGGTAAVGSMSYSVPTGTSGIRQIPAGIPGEFSLSQNYPNPFNPSTAFTFTISSAEFVSIKVYDLLGREIAELAGKVMNPGNYEATFDTNDLPSGIYVYRMVAGTYVETRKMNVIK